MNRQTEVERERDSVSWRLVEVDPISRNNVELDWVGVDRIGKQSDTGNWQRKAR